MSTPVIFIVPASPSLLYIFISASNRCCSCLLFCMSIFIISGSSSFAFSVNIFVYFGLRLPSSSMFSSTCILFVPVSRICFSMLFLSGDPLSRCCTSLRSFSICDSSCLFSLMISLFLCSFSAFLISCLSSSS